MAIFDLLFIRANRYAELSVFYASSFAVIFTALSAQCFLFTNARADSACIIIHGTWAKEELWYRPGGDFFEAVASCNDELNVVDKVVSFSWSGKLGYLAQIEAGKELANLIDLFDSVILICHSHGATIGMIAAEIIFKNDTVRNKNGKIDQFYALGVPVQESTITPNMFVIKKFYNLFSFGDFVQTVNGICNRTFFAHDFLANISVQINNVHPTHGELHHPTIGMWLLKIDTFFAKRNVGNFENFSFSFPGNITFVDFLHPFYVVEKDQEALLKIDKKLHELATFAFFRGANGVGFDDLEQE